MKYLNSLISVFTFSVLVFACQKSETKQTGDIDNKYLPKSCVEVKNPEWIKNATVYEVNIRQYTPEGTFKAFEALLSVVGPPRVLPH